MSRLYEEGEDESLEKLDILHKHLKGLQEQTDNLYNSSISPTNFNKTCVSNGSKQADSQTQPNYLDGREFILDYIQNIPDDKTKPKQNNLQRVSSTSSSPSCRFPDSTTILNLKTNRSSISPIRSSTNLDSRIKNNVSTYKIIRNNKETEKCINSIDKEVNNNNHEYTYNSNISNNNKNNNFRYRLSSSITPTYPTDNNKEFNSDLNNINNDEYYNNMHLKDMHNVNGEKRLGRDAGERCSSIHYENVNNNQNDMNYNRCITNINCESSDSEDEEYGCLHSKRSRKVCSLVENLKRSNDRENEEGNIYRLKLKDEKRRMEEEWKEREKELVRHMNRNAQKQLEQEVERLSRECSSRIRIELGELEEKWKDKMHNFRIEVEKERESLLVERRKSHTNELHLKEMLQSLQNEKRNLQSEVEQLTNETNYMSKKLDSLKKEQKTIEMHRSEAQKNLIALQSSYEELNAKFQNEKNSSNRLQCELEHANNQFNHMLNKNRQLELKLEAAEEGKESQEKLSHNILLDKKEIQTKYENIMKTYCHLKDECDISNREVKKLQYELQNLNEQINAKTSSEKNANRIVEELREREIILKEELKVFQQKIAATEQVERELKNLKIDMDNLKLEVERLRDENLVLRAENKQLLEKKSKLQLENQAANNEILSVHQELHSLKKQLQNEIKNKDVVLPSRAHVQGGGGISSVHTAIPPSNLHPFSNATSPLHPLNVSSTIQPRHNTKNMHNCTTLISSEVPFQSSYNANYNAAVNSSSHANNSKNVYKISSCALTGTNMSCVDEKNTCLQDHSILDSTSISLLNDNSRNMFTNNPTNRSTSPSPLISDCQNPIVHTHMPSLRFKSNLVSCPITSDLHTKKSVICPGVACNNNINYGNASVQMFSTKNYEDELQQNRSLEQQLMLLSMERNKIEGQLAKYPSATQGKTLKERETKLHLDKRLCEVDATIQKLRQELRFRKNSRN